MNLLQARDQNLGTDSQIPPCPTPLELSWEPLNWKAFRQCERDQSPAFRYTLGMAAIHKSLLRHGLRDRKLRAKPYQDSGSSCERALGID